MSQQVKSNDLNTDESDAQKLTSPEVVAQFTNGLVQISESLVAIRDGFSSVENELTQIAGTQVFLTDWRDLRNNKFPLIDESFKATSNALRVFLEGIEPTVIAPAAAFASKRDNSESKKAAEETKEDAEDELEPALQRSTKISKDSKDLVNSYEDFKKRIIGFQKRLEPFVQTHKKRTNQELDELSNEVKKQQAQRDELAAQIKEKIQTIGRAKFARNAWLRRLPLLNLLAVLLSLHIDRESEAELTQMKAEYEVLTQQILETRMKLQRLTSDVDELDLVLVKLSSMTDNRLEDVSSGVHIFNDVSEAGHHDLELIQAYLANPDDTKLPWILYVYNQTKTSVYSGIKTALGNFSLS